MNPKTKLRLRTLRQLVQLVCGSVIAALGYASFQVPYGIAAGGVSGLAIILAPHVPSP